jgi:cytochrome c553
MLRKRWLFFPLFLVAALSAGIFMAQSATTSPSNLICDRDKLIEIQADYHALLDDFPVQLDEHAEATLALLYETGTAYRQLAIDCGYVPPDIGEHFVGSDVDRILEILETLNGDPLNGQLLYNNEEAAADGSVIGCVGCHENQDIAPLTEGTWTRWDEIRRHDPELADYSFEQYTVESIVLPWDYLVAGYGEVMPNNYGERLSFQDMADLIAYLESQDQFLD